MSTKHLSTVADRSLIQLSWPILFELSMLFMIPAVDAFYISKISEVAVGSVTAVLPITGLAMIIFFPLTQAASSIAAQHLGAGKEDRARATFTYSLLLNFGLGLLMALFLIGSAPYLPLLVGLPESMAAYARDYVFVLGFGFLPLAMRIACSGILSARGLTLANMVSAVVMNLLNYLFNEFFIHGAMGLPPFKVEAVAFSSCCAWLGALLISAMMVLVFARFKPQLHAEGLTAAHGLRTILRIGVPSTLEPASFQLSQIAISKILVSLGTLSLTTKAFLGNITLLPLLWSAAFAQGTQIKVSFLLGQRSLERAQKELLSGVKIALTGVTILSLCLLIWSDTFFGIFTQDPAIHSLGRKALAIALILEWGRCLNVVVGSVLRGSGDAKFVALVALFSMWTIGVGGSWLFSQPWGLLGIWFAMTLDEHFRGWVSLRRWMKGHWQKKVLYKPTETLEVVHAV